MFKAFIKTSILTVLLSVILFNAPLTYAETIVFEDDFSNGFEKWESVRNNFDLWDIIDEQANAFINKDSTLAELVPKDMYWNKEWKNIIYELDYKYLRGADRNISFGFKDVRNWYEIHFVGNSFFLSHVKNGHVVWDYTGNQRLMSGFNHISINLNEGLIIVNVNGKEIINVTDPTFDNDYGKIGIKAGAGAIFPTHVIYDNIVVKYLNDDKNKLNIAIQKQTNPIWGKEEYDSASKWINKNQNIDLKNIDSKIGIDRWGCLITSISMIMNFHGINRMPDDNPVNPSTINAWLKSQPDGYISSGLVNWLAITRLTALINKKYSTPKFEYKRIAGDSFSEAKDKINKKEPVILQIPGHFLVGSGIVENEEDLYIADPAYNYDKFSQHQKSLVSTRTLTPSFTDLSYIHISHSSDLNIKIKNEDGTSIDNLQQFEDYLNYFDSNEKFEGEKNYKLSSPKTKIYEIEKPKSGTYILEISQDNFQKTNLTIFTYDKNGDLSDLSLPLLVGKNKIKLRLNYNNQGDSYIEQIINFDTLLNDISELKKQNDIKKYYVAQELRQLTQLGKVNNDNDSLRYIEAIKQLVSWYSTKITEKGVNILNQRLLKIETQLKI